MMMMICVMEVSGMYVFVRSAWDTRGDEIAASAVVDDGRSVGTAVFQLGRNNKQYYYIERLQGQQFP